MKRAYTVASKLSNEESQLQDHVLACARHQLRSLMVISSDVIGGE